MLSEKQAAANRRNAESSTGSAAPARRRDAAPSTSAGSRRRNSWPRAARGSGRATCRPRPRARTVDQLAAGSTRTPTRPESRRSARPRSGHGARRRSGSPRSVWVELLGKKHARRLQDLVRTAQLEVLLAEPLDLFALLTRRQTGPQASVGLSLAHTLSQRLLVDPEIAGDVRDRPAAFKRQPDAALEQLLGVLPRSRHDSGESPLPRTASWNRGPRQTRSGSPGRSRRQPAPTYERGAGNSIRSKRSTLEPLRK